MLRLCAVLCAYNKSPGYRWSAIPKPPPRGVDRLYGTHAVLSTLRVFAQPKESGDTTTCAPALTDATQAYSHPHRQRLFRLYVRDFSLDEPTEPTASTRPSSEATQAHPARRRKVIPARYSAVHRIVALAKHLQVPISFVPRAELVQLCGERRNQHVVLEVSSFSPTPIHSLAQLFTEDEGTAKTGPSASVSSTARRVVMYLDHIVDPTNVGNLLRTAFFNGVDDLILSTDSASCTAAVSRTSTGFLEYMRVFHATVPTAVFLERSRRDWEALGSHTDKNLPSSPRDHVMQLDVIATTTTTHAVAAHAVPATAPEPVEVVPTSQTSSAPVASHSTAPTCDGGPAHVQVLLLGNEAHGLSDEVLRQCTHTMHVRSPRQERLRAAAAATAVAAPATAPGTLSSDPPVEDLEQTRAYAVRRLWKLRPVEVTLNVNAACAAVLCLLTSDAYRAHLQPIPPADAVTGDPVLQGEDMAGHDDEESTPRAD